ncbi:hypothetical protein LZC95_00370 [Pendulispora brunnea]|uniref:Uncharacterized protein n=1 Tax=Pendulispora brunnea TaxID=2905690 RepID=A0ABZ2K9H4_9BACT
MNLRPQNQPFAMQLERFPEEDEEEFDRNRSTHMAQITNAAQDLGFEGYWFNDKCVSWLERKDGSVLYVETVYFQIYTRGYFNDSKERDFVQEYLTECVGLSPAK